MTTPDPFQEVSMDHSQKAVLIAASNLPSGRDARQKED